MSRRSVALLPIRTRDGRTLHAERHGDGGPVVVFESALGISRSMWGAVVDELPPAVTAVVYDRSGLGRSAPDPAGRDLARLAGDLVDVLRELGEGPVVLVGHSWGGPVIRGAAALAPERIAGLVLVDATDERCDLFFAAANRRQVAWSPWLLPLTARLGLVRLLVRKLAGQLPSPWAAAMRAEDGTAAAVRTQIAELASSIDDLRLLRSDPPLLPDVPVVVVSGTKHGLLERSRRPALVAAHRATADDAPKGRHVLAERSGHYVPFSEPALVAEEIQRVVSSLDP